MTKKDPWRVVLDELMEDNIFRHVFDKNYLVKYMTDEINIKNLTNEEEVYPASEISMESDLTSKLEPTMTSHYRCYLDGGLPS